jgi:hypothetical protein
MFRDNFWTIHGLSRSSANGLMYCIVFADDLSASCAAKKLTTIEKAINLYLKKLENWVRLWRLTMSTNNCNFIKDEATDHILAWIERTTSHGLPSIVRANNIVIKIMWILFFLASLTYCSYVIIMSLIDYFKYATVVRLNLIKVTIVYLTLIIMNIL